jgi:molybdopterin-synthase adenylyltransferase
MNSEERYSRQASLVPASALADRSVTIVGVGAIGRNIALQLSSMGVQRLSLIDFDKVEESNIASQGYLEEDIGRYKVDATANQCQKINGDMHISAIAEGFKPNTEYGDVVFCCVDSIELRKRLYSIAGPECELFIDGRMQGEVFRVLSVSDDESHQHYLTTLFSEEEAQQGSCTAKSTIYCAFGAACFETQSLAKWLRKVPVPKDLLVNLATNELIVLKE